MGDAVMGTLANFELERILGDDAHSKKVSCLGKLRGQEGSAIVVLSRRHLTADLLPSILSAHTTLNQTFQNDIYSKFEGRPSTESSAITVDLIYPATQKHIDKHTTQALYLLHETPEAYAEVTRPYILSIPPKRIQWVYNILDKSAEADRLIFEDEDPSTGFMLHPDLKWDQVDPESLYCIAICHRKDVRSLRDLSTEHLPLLKNIRDKVSAEILKRYHIQPCQLRMYIHYQPSYYHFHVHIVHTNLDGGLGMAAGRAHLLPDVVDNIANVRGDYYAVRTLPMALGENDPLYARFVDAKGRDWVDAGGQ